MADRLERLLNLTAALLDASRPLTVGRDPRAGARLPRRRRARRSGAPSSGTRTTLREMGIPLGSRTIPGADPPDAATASAGTSTTSRDPGLEPDELAALHLAAAAVRLDGLPGTRGALEARRARRAATATGPDVGRPARRSPHLVPLFGAVAERAPVDASATTTRPRRSTRTGSLPPRPLVPRRLRPRPRGAERQFRLDRIEGEVERRRRRAASSARPHRRPGAAAAVAARRERAGRRPGAGRRRPGAAGPSTTVGRRRASSRAHDDGSVVVDAHRSPTATRSARSCSASSTTPRSLVAARAARRRRRLARGARGAVMAPARSADDRLRRLLALVPWVVAHDGPTVDEVCARFGVDRGRAARRPRPAVRAAASTRSRPTSLIEVEHRGRPGLDPATPTPSTARCASRPRRASPSSPPARALLAVPGADPEGPLARGLAKLADVARRRPRRGHRGRPRHRARPACSRRCAARSPATPPGRDRLLRLRPRRAHRGGSSIRGPSTPPRASGTCRRWCHLAEAERLFRVDRIRGRRACSTRTLRRRPASSPRRRVVRRRRRTTPGSCSSSSPGPAGWPSSTRSRRSRSSTAAGSG